MIRLTVFPFLCAETLCYSLGVEHMRHIGVRISSVVVGRFSPVRLRQYRLSPYWSLAHGTVLGLGLGAGALSGIGGLLGVGLCLTVLLDVSEASFAV
jgi:hypothetical protein